MLVERERVLGRLESGDLPDHQVAPLRLGQQAGAGPLLHHLGRAVALGVSWGITELEKLYKFSHGEERRKEVTMVKCCQVLVLRCSTNTNIGDHGQKVML